MFYISGTLHPISETTITDPGVLNEKKFTSY